MIPQYKKRNKNIFAFTIESMYEQENYDGKTAFIDISCPVGFGYSVANALRRSLLSSVSGCGIVAVKIDNCNSPFSAIPGVDRLANVIYDILTTVRCNITDDSEYLVTSVSKETKDNISIKASMFQTSNLIISNGDTLICNIANTSFNMSLLIGRGYNYMTEQEQRQYFVSGFSPSSGWFPIGAIFSGITKCAYRVISTERCDTITMEVSSHSDCNIENALQEVSRDLSIVFGGVLLKDSVDNEIYDDSLLDMQIDESQGLPIRVVNVLTDSAGIVTLRGLLSVPPSQLLKYEGIGNKSIEDIGHFLTYHISVSELAKMKTLKASELYANACLYCEAYNNSQISSKKKSTKKNAEDSDDDDDKKTESTKDEEMSDE
jgi:DNA-directed RNA polymerase subunit alpha